MTQAEGVIQFRLDYTPSAPHAAPEIGALDGWRSVLRRLGLIGQDAARYDGAGFGNLSARRPPHDAPPGSRRFVITGSQTGGLAALDGRHFALVTAYDIAGNRVAAQGPIAPSSEALTHGMLYDLDAGIRCVMHVHAPEIWRRAAALGLPRTDPAAGYGTPAMAAEVARLHRESDLAARRLLVMGGHLDGVVSFGRDIDAAATVLLTGLARALAR
ncbi:MAG TPA: class II aldolase/adducin family protein [Acidiferrobacterales bacterium]